MTTVDTLKESQELQDSGMPPKQAEATVRFVGKVESGLVTKEHFDAGMKQTRFEFDAKLERLNAELTKEINKAAQRYFVATSVLLGIAVAASTLVNVFVG